MEKRIIELLFPECEKNEDIKIDEESIHYITPFSVADRISNIILYYLRQRNIENDIIIDCMAGVGGNTISFCKYFKKVIGIEIDKIRFEYLVNNLKVYNYNNFECYNDNFLNLIYNIKFNTIFLDPPWGGKDYKTKEKLTLKINNVNIEDICNNILNSNKCIITIKLPKNYDLYFFYKNLKKYSIFLYEFKKMNLLIVL